MIDIKEFSEKIKEDLVINFELKDEENFLNNPMWDSLLNMGLLAHLDREYNISIDFDDLLKHNSFIKLYKLISK